MTIEVVGNAFGAHAHTQMKTSTQEMGNTNLFIASKKETIKKHTEFGLKLCMSGVRFLCFAAIEFQIITFIVWMPSIYLTGGFLFGQRISSIC